MHHVLRKSVALALLCSHLLTLTNCHHMNLPMEAQDSLNKPANSSLENNITTHSLSEEALILTEEKAVAPLNFIVQGDHQVTIENSSAQVTTVTFSGSGEVVKHNL